MVLACPSVSQGHVRVELYGLRKTQVRDGRGGACMHVVAEKTKLFLLLA